jgi:hypothetical protein
VSRVVRSHRSKGCLPRAPAQIPRCESIPEIDKTSAKGVAEGLVQSFDPDYVVLTGRYEKLTIGVGHRKVIRAAEILEGFADHGTAARP